MITVFNTFNNFTSEIEYLLQNDHTLLEALVEYATKYKIEYEVIAELIKKDESYLNILQEEAENLHFLKPQSRLPI